MFAQTHASSEDLHVSLVNKGEILDLFASIARMFSGAPAQTSKTTKNENNYNPNPFGFTAPLERLQKLAEDTYDNLHFAAQLLLIIPALRFIPLGGRQLPTAWQDKLLNTYTRSLNKLPSPVKKLNPLPQVVQATGWIEASTLATLRDYFLIST